MRTGWKTSNRGPRACFRGSSNAIGNAIGAPKTYIARTRRIRSFGSGPFADGGKVASFREGRMSHREWARPSGRLGGIHSIEDRYDHDVDELMA